MIQDLLDGTKLEDLSPPEYGQILSQHAGLVKVVGDHHQGDSGSLLDLQQLLPQA
jgi:hypothetical protein